MQQSAKSNKEIVRYERAHQTANFALALCDENQNERSIRRINNCAVNLEWLKFFLNVFTLVSGSGAWNANDADRDKMTRI